MYVCVCVWGGCCACVSRGVCMWSPEVNLRSFTCFLRWDFSLGTEAHWSSEDVRQVRFREAPVSSCPVLRLQAHVATSMVPGAEIASVCHHTHSPWAQRTTHRSLWLHLLHEITFYFTLYWIYNLYLNLWFLNWLIYLPSPQKLIF